MKENLKREEKEKYLNAKLSKLVFYRSPQLNLSQVNKPMISKLKLEGLGPK